MGGQTSAFKRRVSYGLLVAFCVVLLLFLDHLLGTAFVFCGLVAAMSLLAWIEYSAMAFPGRPGWRAAGACAVVLSNLAAGFVHPGGNLLLQHAVFCPAVLFAFALWPALTWNGAQPTFGQVSCWIFGVLYLGYLPTFVVEARHLYGENLTILFLLTVKLGDSGSYIVGKAIGRHNIFRVSPRKTLEGSFGGLAAAALTALVGARVLLPDRAAGDLALAVSALIISLMAQGGDLIESLLKRSSGAKHSAPLFPEVGGILDMIDSVLFASPVFYGLACLGRSKGLL